MIKAVFFISLFAAAYLFYHWSTQVDRNIENSILEAKPTFVAEGFTSYVYNADGNLYQVVNAENVEYYRNVELMQLVKPDVKYFPQLDQENTSLKEVASGEGEFWRMTADSGIINNDDNVMLSGNVKLTNSNKLALVHEVLSDFLEFDLTTNDVRTPDRVTMIGQDFINTGVGFSGNTKTRNFTLNEDCHAKYSGTFKK